jgi:hypothetical protein
MAEPTPDEVRGAAQVLRLLDESLGINGGLWGSRTLEARADVLEQAQAERAKREARVEELAEELCDVGHGALGLACWQDTIYRDGWRELASFLADRYPALLDD